MTIGLDTLASHEVPVSSVRSRFGNYRAEWFKSEHDFVELFVEPGYFPELSDDGCSLLVGRRGSGKTSALRGLSYLSVQERVGWGRGIHPIGLYHKFDIGVAGAMKGPPLSEDEWARIFGHYMNLIALSMAVSFAEWMSQLDDWDSDFRRLLDIGSRYVQSTSHDLRSLSSALSDRMFELETSINAVGPKRAAVDTPLTTAAGIMAPLSDALLEDTGSSSCTKVLFLFDELETLTIAQQKVINTIIKQAGQSYSVKVCSKERGWKTRETLVTGQVLSAPADYSLIDIDRRLAEGRAYSNLAERICEKRIGSVFQGRSMVEVFPQLTSLEEALLLGLEPTRVASDLKSLISNRFDLDASPLLDRLNPLDQYVLIQLFRRRGGTGRGGGRHVIVTERFLRGNGKIEPVRSIVSNYRIPALFTIRPSTRGDRRIFTGWRNLLQLSGGTIRHLMQLIEWAIASAEQNRSVENAETLLISIEDQHFATRQVAEVYLREIRSFSPYGSELYNLALGIGQFQALLARNAFAHAPDLNQFTVSDPDNDERVGTFLDHAIMEGVLLRKRRTKRPNPSVIPTDEYRLNPVLAPYFPFSPTEKRAYRIHAEEFIALALDPQRGVWLLAARYDEAPDKEGSLF